MLVLLAPCIFDVTGCSPGPLSLCGCAPTRASAGWLMFGARAGGLAVALLTFKSRCPSRPVVTETLRDLHPSNGACWQGARR